MAFCSKCGSPISDTARFCRTCGSEEHPIRPQQPQPAAQEVAPQQPQYVPEPAAQPQYAPPPAAQQPQFVPEPAAQPQYVPNPAPQQPQYVPNPTPQQPQFIPQPSPAPYVPAPSAAGTAAATAAKASTSLLTKIICFGLIAAVLIVAANHFKLWNLFKSDEDLIRERFQIMEDCFNDGDLEGYLGCMDSASSAAAQMMLDMAGGLMSDYMGFDMNFGDMMSFGTALGGGDVLQIEVHDVQVDGKEAYATATFRMDFYGEVMEETMEFPMIKEGNEWFINGQISDAMDELMGMVG